MSIFIPADVPKSMEKDYKKNYEAITGPEGRMLLFAADQKVEHLNQDFYGSSIDPAANNPQHIFEIAQKGNANALATHLGLIARYGHAYPEVNYIVKLNAKTNLVSLDRMDARSTLLWSVADVIQFQKSNNLPIRGIGYTLYLGSSYEPEMLHQAAQSIFQAHQNGLIAILWCYVRSKDIKNDQDPKIIAGATGIAASLGADFVKVKPPKTKNENSFIEALQVACTAAGNTKVICSGGPQVTKDAFFEKLENEIKAGTAGCAVGRNIFQKSLPEAIKFIKLLAEIIRIKT